MARPPADRLESWKEIAAFIGRDERTAMRWAKGHGMPVRRAPGHSKGRVYASRGEISRWLEGQAQESPGAEAAVAAARPRKIWVISSGVIGMSLLALLLAWSSIVARPRRAVRVGFSDDSVEIWDGAGRKLWTHQFPRPFEERLIPSYRSLTSLAHFVDLERGREREVIVAAPFSEGANLQGPFHIEVDAFSSAGKLLWSYIPNESFQFGSNRIGGGWQIFDLRVSRESARPVIWAAFDAATWGNSFVVELDARTGGHTVKFVNTGILYSLGELKTTRGAYLLIGGFNNEQDGGSLAIMDERKAFAASPQTRGTRHECVSCPAGAPDVYLVFPRSELNVIKNVYPTPVTLIEANGGEIQISKNELGGGSAARAIYLLRTEPSFQIVSVRFDTDYDQMHHELERAGALRHTIDDCPERLEPKPVRMWTPAGGWTELRVPATAAHR